jgi:arsenate reductase (thioredoxin)
MTTRPKVLFLCRHNSCRSQMAEGWARTLLTEHVEPYSAGVAKRAVDPGAIAVMREAGVDISGHSSKTLDELADVDFDLVVAVCAQDADFCPTFPGGVRQIHTPFDDPPQLARTAATEEERLGYYRRVRDEIRAMVERLPEVLGSARE